GGDHHLVLRGDCRLPAMAVPGTRPGGPGGDPAGAAVLFAAGEGVRDPGPGGVRPVVGGHVRRAAAGPAALAAGRPDRRPEHPLVLGVPRVRGAGRAGADRRRRPGRRLLVPDPLSGLGTPAWFQPG